MCSEISPLFPQGWASMTVRAASSDPVAVSRRREYFRMQPETFGVRAAKVAKLIRHGRSPSGPRSTICLAAKRQVQPDPVNVWQLPFAGPLERGFGAAAGSNCPVIFMTAIDDEVTRGGAAGCVAYRHSRRLNRVTKASGLPQ